MNRERTPGLPSAESERVLWRAGQVGLFPSAEVGSILGTEAQPIQHPLFGKGFAYPLVVDSEPSTIVQVFPERATVRLRVPIQSGSVPEYENREYPIVSILTRNGSTPPALSFHSSRFGRRITVNLYPDGSLDEFQRMTPFPFPTPEKFAERGMVTVKEASQISGIHRKTLQRLAQKGSIPSVRMGRLWYLDRAAVESLRDPGPSTQPTHTHP